MLEVGFEIIPLDEVRKKSNILVGSRYRTASIHSFKLSTNELLICNEMSVSSLITEHRGYGTKLKEFKKVLADYCQEMGYI